MPPRDYILETLDRHEEKLAELERGHTLLKETVMQHGFKLSIPTRLALFFTVLVNLVLSVFALAQLLR